MRRRVEPLSSFSNDPRTIILGDDGRHVTLGRHSAPDEAEIAQAVAALERQGMGGWLATMSGTLYQRRCPTLTMLRSLGQPRQSWGDAVAAFRANHAETLAGLGSKRS